MTRITWRHRLRYWFDNTMSRGTIALIGWLFVLSAVMILLLAGLIVVLGLSPAGDDGQPLSYPGMIWFGLMRTLDAGTMGGDTGSVPFLLLSLSITLGGIFLVSALIGVLNSGLESKLEDLRKGRSFVVERNHTVILGWSSQVFSIISELVIANENQPDSCIVLMADKDKIEMEDEVRDRLGSTGKTRIVCRTGSPIDLTDLEIVNLNDAKAIVILSGEVDNPDSSVIKTLLAITNNPHRRAERFHIVAEIREPQNLQVAQMVARDEAQIILVGDMISRIAVQTCRQSGLSVVYTELLDFGGDEIYFQEEPRLTGKTFRESLFCYDDSTVIGLSDADGKVTLNPSMDTVIEAGSSVVAIAEDDDKVRLSGVTSFGVDESAISNVAQLPAAPERTLVLGWNHRGTVIINELDNYVAPGSDLLVVADTDGAKDTIEQECAGVKNMRVTYDHGDITDRRMLDRLFANDYDHIITLSYFDVLDPQEADARTLTTLLHLRDISDRTGKRMSIVSEMLDDRNRELAAVTQADDFIVSDKLISLLISQVAENAALMSIFDDLFDPDGSEIYLKPAGQYVLPGRPVNFYTILEAAARRGEVAIGYRLVEASNDASRQYGVRVNPPKSESVTLGERDRVIVLAEN
jgi:voltage-gated potassium channel Kch